ncbi:metallophosphoesterase [Variovorax paradoxus]|nr:metallophosphoesterase [Variovorax paradoxus]MBT2304537.1 metallophosphoesterase [Variovorax paradoxus]
MVTILHISDLHRDSGSRLTTGSLLESLRLDRDRYVGATLRPPDLAIVSGDVVYGVNSNEADSDARLKGQYDEACDFLARLADLFFDGDRERIVLVPGNHDVSHPHVLRATAPENLPVEKDKRAMLAKQLAAEGGSWRWAWEDFSLRRVVDQNEYQRRMEPFAQFFSAFYKGRRSFSLDPAGQFSLHDFPGLGIVVAGLSSCCDNDLFNRSGRIHPDAVAGATRAVADFVRRGRVPIAVWHHNLAGGPRDSDYVDADFLQSLIDGRFVLGLHGHQHRPQFLEHRFTADRKRALAVISAGTLCGGPHSLPSGRKRAYNLIELSPEDGCGILQVREMKNEGFSLPVWGEGYVPEFGGSTMRFELSMAAPAASGTHAAAEAAQLLHEGDARGALALVRPHAGDALARRVTVQALLQLEDWPGLRQFCGEPRSNTEIVALCEALYQVGDKPALGDFIKSEAVVQNSDAAVRQSIERARARLGGRR